jgi:hypothetical protein
VEQNRGPRYESIQLYPPHFYKDAKNYHGEKRTSSTNVAEESGYLSARN